MFMRRLCTLIVVAPLACTDADPSGPHGPGDPDIGQEAAALAVYSEDGATLIIYEAPSDKLTPGNLASMDRGVILGFPWTRVEVPALLGTFDVGFDDDVSIRHESFQAHPYEDEVVPILLDFAGGLPGLSGWLAVEDVGPDLRASYDLLFQGDYELFRDLGPTYLEVRMSQDYIEAEDPDGP
jgi:hypothetical protein